MSPQGRSGVGPYPDPDVPAGPVRVEARAQSGQVLEYDAEANDGASKHGAGKRRCNNARRISTAAPAKTVEFATGAPNLGQGRGTQVGVS